jgi:DNA-directed RNA polymerase specialized sigma54-like protein
MHRTSTYLSSEKVDLCCSIIVKMSGEIDPQRLLSMTPQLQKAIRLLERPQAELAGLIEAELADNPRLRIGTTLPEERFDAEIGEDLELRVPDAPEFTIEGDVDDIQRRDADWFQRALLQRQRTIRRVLKIVVRQQAAWLRGDTEERAKVSPRDVASELGFHESTIKRVLANKRANTPRGELSLDELLG